MPPSAARRQGSPFTGIGPVFMKELADHLSSVRMLVLALFVIVIDTAVSAIERRLLVWRPAPAAGG